MQLLVKQVISTMGVVAVQLRYLGRTQPNKSLV